MVLKRLSVFFFNFSFKEPYSFILQSLRMTAESSNGNPKKVKTHMSPVIAVARGTMTKLAENVAI